MVCAMQSKSPAYNKLSDIKISISKLQRRVSKVEVKFSLYRPLRPLGSREFEAPTFWDIRLTDISKVVSPTRRPLLNPRKIPGTHFC
jgi:hypothetical protein